MLDYKKNTNLNWEIIAQHNPYWGVLTHDKFLTEASACRVVICFTSEGRFYNG